MAAQSTVASNVTADLDVEYVNTSGTHTRTTVVDGVTSISGTAPFFVHFDATGTRSTETDGDTEDEAWRTIGYRLNYGESIGGNWGLAGAGAVDEDLGPPIFGRSFTQAGTHTVQLKVKDSAGGEDTISLDVVVSAPSSPTNIPVGDGAWPTWASGGRYTLDRDSDYTSFGQLSFGGESDIIIYATGTGADPIIGTVNFETRGILGTVMTSTRHVRFHNIDVNVMGASVSKGFQFCGAHGGRVRGHTGMSVHQFFWNGETGETEHNNVTYPRGFFLTDTGVMLANIGGDTSYNYIGECSAIHFQNVEFEYDSSGSNHSLRGVWHECSIRNCLIWHSTAGTSYWICQGGGASATDPPDTWDTTNYRVGLHGTGPYNLPASKSFMWNCQLGKTGHATPAGPGGLSPENEVGNVQGTELCGMEDTTYFETTTIGTAVNAMDYGGRELFQRNCKRNLGAGTEGPAITSDNSGRIPTGWDGAYRNEDTNTRPVPTAF